MVSATGIFARLREKHHAKLRELDLQILWPTLLGQAKARGLSEESARQAFILHSSMERAWSHMTPDEIREILITRKPANRGG